MSNALINFYHNLEEPIIIYDKKQNIIYHFNFLIILKDILRDFIVKIILKWKENDE